MRSIPQIAQQLPISLERGLAQDAIQKSTQLFGSNALTPLLREPIWRKFLAKFDEPIIKILLAAALLSIIVDLFRADSFISIDAFVLVAIVVGVAFAVPRFRPWAPACMLISAVLCAVQSAALGHPSYEGLAVMLAVILATGVSFLSEYRSDREFETLNAGKESIHVKVTRAEAITGVLAEQVVVGDLVTLETGDEIPADGRVVRSSELSVDQSLLTGETEPVAKTPPAQDDAGDGPGHPGCLYRGTQVVDGVGQMIVTEVGDDTMMGQIARHLSVDNSAQPDANRVQQRLTISKEFTPLQQKLAELARLISNVGYVAAGLIFLALLIRGALRHEVFLPADRIGFLEVAGKLLEFIMYTVIIIVVAVPEGLPMSVTIALALAMRKMTRANALVRQLVACETIGSATVICTDKTGTLTQNKMQVVRLFVGGRTLDRGTREWPSLNQTAPWPRNGSPLDCLALIAAANSTAHLTQTKAGNLAAFGNTTEGALLLWLHENGLEYQALRSRFPPAYQVHFSSERKRMTTVIQYGSRLAVLVKGAPESVAAQSTHHLNNDGSVALWTPQAREQLQQALAAAAGQAMRTLGFAFAVLPPETLLQHEVLHANRDQLEQDLVFAGFVAIRDPLREDVQNAVHQCREAGIEVKMITGDNPNTARAIAAEIGLLDIADPLVLTSQEFNALSDDRLKEQMPRLRVLARALPLDKLRLVRLLQEQNEVVAMTGDGANDAPSLKKADVGLAMGVAGTEVAKEASKIVLLDDAFSTIVKAVHWGRSLYENIQRFIQFQLTINVSALTIAFLGPFLNIRPPFTVLQLLWINVVMDTFASIALCSEPPRPGLMKMRPKRRNENIITRPMAFAIFSTAAFFVVAMTILLLVMKYGQWFAAGSGMDPEGWEFAPLNVRQVSVFFSVYVLFQVWNLINCRSLAPDRSGLAGLWQNPMFLLIAGLTVAGQVAIVSFGGAIFRVEPLTWIDWLELAALTSVVLIFGHACKWVIARFVAQPKTA
jgi:Ca2+-transporting ATPase